MNSSNDHTERDSRIQQIVAAFRDAVNIGVVPDVDPILEKHPSLADDLRPLLQAIASATSGADGTADPFDVVATDASVQPDEITVNWSPGSSAFGIEDPNITRAHAAGSSSTDAAHDTGEISSAIGSTIGGYRVLRLLGRGGMGEVYEVEEVKTGRNLALKLLSTRLPRTNETIERFLNEASLAASFSHPRTTFVYGAGQEEGQFYIAMELMPGKTLKDVIEQRGPLPINEAVDHAINILDGLEAAHRRGVIHRDLKPTNCFVDEEGRTKVGDFGLAKSLISDSDITRTGTFLGTPQFAAPEQIRHDDVDQRTDIFAVGATLYFLLTGHAPFKGDAAAVIAQIVADAPPKIRSERSEVPKSLQRIISRCLSKNPKRRYASADELRKALLPFATEGVSMAEIGRRLAAYFFDMILVSVFVAIVAVALGILNEILEHIESPWLLRPALPSFTANVAIVAVPYFAIAESIWGSSLGKRWLGIHVVNAYGEPPAFWQSMVRALVLPGFFVGATEMAEAYLRDMPSFVQATELAISNEILRKWLVPEFFSLVKVLLCALCFTPMRKSNGYRGIHGLLSGTRVVRVLTGTNKSVFRWLELYRRAAVPGDDLPQRLGPYTVLGRLGRHGPIDVLEGQDDALKRPVWLYRTDADKSHFLAERVKVQRATRQRCLQEGVSDGKHWYALESIDGGPLTALYTPEGTLPWEAGREALPELAAELSAAVQDDTLPETLGIDQLWMDRDGSLRLLDYPLGQTESAESPRKLDLGDNELQRAWRLFREVVSRCRWHTETPGRVADYLIDLEQVTPTQTSFANARERLQEAVRIPFRLDWDRRLGIQTVSLAVEGSFIGAWCFLSGYLSATLAGFNLLLAIGLALCLCPILPFVMAYWFNGGPAFWLSGFEVRNIHTRRLSRIRAAFRTAIAWAPFVVPITLFRVYLFEWAALESLPEDAAAVTMMPGMEAISPADDKTALVVGLVVLALPCVLLFTVGIIGVAAAISSPSRGIQDRIAGTYLVRK